MKKQQQQSTWATTRAIVEASLTGELKAKMLLWIEKKEQESR